ncbi:site-specific integrase [Sphingobacterium siyangense]|uniref:site-specific integrase n=1 Tax=Sphingobacterium TaxID=28453 RepID=UPI002579B980|nr:MULTISPECIES: site-specific integrase [Sphingobacterium]
MLENSYGLIFFLKTPKKKTNMRYVYVRVTVDGVPKETSTKRIWDARRWDQDNGRAVGNKEDAKTLNFFLDCMVTKINQFKTDLIYANETISSKKIIDFIKGKTKPKLKLLEEFNAHNDEVLALVPTEYAKGTHERFMIAYRHVKEFIAFKYDLEDIEFRELDYEFVTDYAFYLKTEKKLSNNTAIKYITNLKKIVLRAVDKDIIPSNPFKRFKSKKTPPNKKPLMADELAMIESKTFSTARLELVRDVFVFQCYTGLAYIDIFQLRRDEIKKGVDGELWIMSARQKTGTGTNIPLLPKAIQIIEKYRDNPECLKRGTVLPVTSNQKMNAYLKEIGDLCGISSTLNTHKARRTFGSTVTLNNDVPINVVKEMLGHRSIKQTEEYAMTEQRTIGREMSELKNKLASQHKDKAEDDLALLNRLSKEVEELKKRLMIKG